MRDGKSLGPNTLSGLHQSSLGISGGDRSRMGDDDSCDEDNKELVEVLNLLAEVNSLVSFCRVCIE